MKSNSRVNILIVIIIPLILTIIGYSQSYIYKTPQKLNDLFWFPLGAIVKVITGNEILMIFSGTLQFFIIFQSAYILNKRNIYFFSIVLIIYLFLLGVAILFL
jgi:hypothetical protein